jgi:hypothetical protein
VQVRPRKRKMKLHELFQRRDVRLAARGETPPACAALPGELPSLDKVRAVAIGAALAVSVDTSPAALAGLQAYAQRHRDRPRRTA